MLNNNEEGEKVSMRERFKNDVTPHHLSRGLKISMEIFIHALPTHASYMQSHLLSTRMKKSV